MNDERVQRILRNAEYVKFTVLVIVMAVTILLVAALVPPMIRESADRLLGQSAQPARGFIPYVSGGDAGAQVAVPRTHVVQAGETLPQIAAQYNVSLDYLAGANNVINPYELAPGTILVIPD